jgi:hypothetical protein
MRRHDRLTVVTAGTARLISSGSQVAFISDAVLFGN